MAVDRYYAIMSPLNRDTLWFKNAKIATPLIWFVAMVLVSMTLVFLWPGWRQFLRVWFLRFWKRSRHQIASILFFVHLCHHLFYSVGHNFCSLCKNHSQSLVSPNARVCSYWKPTATRGYQKKESCSNAHRDCCYVCSLLATGAGFPYCSCHRWLGHRRLSIRSVCSLLVCPCK